MNSFLISILIIAIYFFIFETLGKFTFYLLKNKIQDFRENTLLGFCIFVILANIFYFNFNFRISFINQVFFISTFFINIFFLKKKIIYKSYNIFFLFIISISIPFLFLYYLYGEQFFVFRGNYYDSFAYTFTAINFEKFPINYYVNSINFNRPIENINSTPLVHGLTNIFQRPAAHIFLSTIYNFKILSVFNFNLIYKIISIILIFFSTQQILEKIYSNKKLIIFYSLCYTFSFWIIYIFEIDAFSQILSFGIFNYCLFNIEKFKDDLISKNIKQSFINLIYLICLIYVYVEIFLIFLFIFLVNLILDYKYSLIIIKRYKLRIFFLFAAFSLAILFQSHLLKFGLNQIINGTISNLDWWMYFGSFILGNDSYLFTDNYLIISVQKLWSEKKIFDLIFFIHEFLANTKSHYFLNILPSIFGYYFFTSLLNQYVVINLIFLIIFNFFLVYLIVLTLNKLFFDHHNLFLKSTIISYLVLNIFLILNLQFWSVIKLYFFFSFFTFYIFFLYSPISLNIKKILLLCLLIFPIYKFSVFNYGIGRFDNFPSILNKDVKINTKFNLKDDLLNKCYRTAYYYNPSQYLKIIYEHNKFNYIHNLKDEIIFYDDNDLAKNTLIKSFNYSYVASKLLSKVQNRKNIIQINNYNEIDKFFYDMENNQLDCAIIYQNNNFNFYYLKN
jgi:hypothetical protein